MQADFWLQRWREGRIGFHKTAVNPLLIRHFPQLRLARGQRVFVPLCGKTLDIGWLLQQGFRVAGVELSETAVEALFARLGVTPEVAQTGRLQRYHSRDLDVFVGDVFDLDAAALGTVDGVYDRAALIALPAAMRRRYVGHMLQLTACAPQLLIFVQYDEALMDGPPFSVPPAEVEQHYGGAYTLTKLAAAAVPDGLKEQVAATQHVWLLSDGALA
ncbi:MAG TPA: thiopurine S-methyltransferase [Salinisphaeraceae bacterium]|nr:thiopurine S-methyltransferase [Salinisphaeraceae bacterium]